MRGGKKVSITVCVLVCSMYRESTPTYTVYDIGFLQVSRTRSLNNNESLQLRTNKQTDTEYKCVHLQDNYTGVSILSL